MIMYREILRLHSQGVSQRGIAASCQCSRTTIRTVIESAERKGMLGSFSEKDLTDANLQELLFPEKGTQAKRKLPDFEYIHKEMAKSGVTLSLLWNEYCEMHRKW
ncbi:MAG: hypothetical protein ACYCV0_17730 [Desulfitobacteriaceae bacterium]